MCHVANILENRMGSRGLGCVWVRVREGRDVRLVARWIREDEPRMQESNAAEEQLTEDGPSEPRLGGLRWAPL